VENLQGVPKVDDKNKDKAVKSISNPKEVSHKWTRKRKLNTKWQAGHP